MDKVSLTASMRSNLLSLQNISRQVDATQNKLSTGKKVNSAIDNPSSYYTARSLSNRAGDLDALLDSMGQAVSTIKAATTSLETAADFLEQASAVATQALESGGTAKPDDPIYIPQPSGISDDAAIRDTSLFDGRANTQAMLDQIGADALAATACNQFYAPGTSKNDANFGQGQWYLPAIGELMEMYGIDAANMTGGTGMTGVNGENKTAINDALTTLKGLGVDCTTLTNSYYWSSSEYTNYASWGLSMPYGNRSGSIKTNYYYYYVRCFQLLENCFSPSTSSADASGGSSGGVAAPKIGDVMYSDLSYGSADDYDGSKTAVGIVTWVSEDGKSAKIVNLKDLRFSSTDTVGNFNPDDPYNGSYSYTYHTTSAKYNEDVTGIDNYDRNQFLAAIQEAVAESALPSAEEQQYQNILFQYDSLIKDSSYKGINLLQSQDLKVTFNESRSAWLDVKGKDASSAALGLTTTEWNTIEDIAQSLKEISSALNQIRTMSAELGSYYNIVLNRQDFTENLINVLEEGADKLTLADMNEESANMLALQTRQQLATNSLSLASQAAQSILRLF